MTIDGKSTSCEQLHLPSNSFEKAMMDVEDDEEEDIDFDAEDVDQEYNDPTISRHIWLR